MHYEKGPIRISKLILTVAALGCASMPPLQAQERVRLGIEVLLSDSIHLVRGKRVGLITNHTGVVPDGRSTIDLVGLTTPATLGTYADWPRAWPALRDVGADYLLYYPAWFGSEGPPPWAEEVARFTIPDNRIVGDSIIAIYRLRWELYDDN